MGEFVESNLEKLIPVYEQLANVQLLEALEVQSLVKRCRRYEYRLAKKEKTSSDFIVYGEYLTELLSLIRSRRARSDYWHKMKDIDGAVITKIASLYRCCCDRFQGDLRNWERLFDFLEKHHRRSWLSKAYGRSLQIHGRNLELRCRSALWEFFGNASADNAPVQMQLALRMYPQEYKLFCTLFRVELGFVNKIIERREFLRKASREVKQQSESDNTSDVDESVFDEEVDDSILQLMVAKVVVTSALKSVPDEYKGEMLLTMWRDLSSFSNLPSAPASDLKDIIEIKISEMGEVQAQLLLIEKDLLSGMDIFEAYDAAVVRLDSEEMYRSYMKMCFSKKNDSLASMKISTLMNVLVDRKWVKSEDMKTIEENIDDILCFGNDRLAILENAVENNPSSVIFWSELIRYHMVGSEDDKKSLILNTLNNAFEKVSAEESLSIWELAIDYAVAYNPDTVDQVFSRAYLTAPVSVSSQVKIIHLEYLCGLCREGSINESERKENVISLMKSKPNTSEFYIAVAEGELARDSQDHKLIRQAFEFSIIENGSSSVDSWIHYGAYCMKHDVCNTSKVYQRAMICLLPSLCSYFIIEWTKLQQKEATLTNEQEKGCHRQDENVLAAIVLVKSESDQKQISGNEELMDHSSPLQIIDKPKNISMLPLEPSVPATLTKKKTQSKATTSPEVKDVCETIVCEEPAMIIPVTPSRKRTKCDSTSSDATSSPARTRRQKAMVLEKLDVIDETDAANNEIIGDTDRKSSVSPKADKVVKETIVVEESELIIPVTPSRKRTKRDSASSDVTRSRSPARTRRQKALALEHPELFEEGEDDV